jgi:hypothetical protein
MCAVIIVFARAALQLNFEASEVILIIPVEFNGICALFRGNANVSFLCPVLSTIRNSQVFMSDIFTQNGPLHIDFCASFFQKIP